MRMSILHMAAMLGVRMPSVRIDGPCGPLAGAGAPCGAPPNLAAPPQFPKTCSSSTSSTSVVRTRGSRRAVQQGAESTNERGRSQRRRRSASGAGKRKTVPRDVKPACQLPRDAETTMSEVGSIGRAAVPGAPFAFSTAEAQGMDSSMVRVVTPYAAGTTICALLSLCQHPAGRRP